MSATIELPKTDTPPVASPRTHLAWLDSLRALAAIYVMIFHMLSTTYDHTNGLRGLSLLMAAPFRYGHFAVELFIVISGFSLMIPVSRSGGFLRGGAVSFYLRRGKRILPTYYAALAISALLGAFVVYQPTGGIWGWCVPFTYRDVLYHIAMLQDVYSRARINPAMWSISVEWRIYFLFPVLVLLHTRYGPAKTILAAMGLATILHLATRHSHLNGITPAYLGLFTLGLCASDVAFGSSRLSQELRNRVPWAQISIFVLIANGILLYAWRNYDDLNHGFCLSIVDGVCCAIAILSVSVRPQSPVRHFLSWRPLATVGTFAYSIYLMHMPLLQIAYQYGIRPRHFSQVHQFMALEVFAGPVIIALGYLFFLAFERPFLNTKPRFEPTASRPALEREAIATGTDLPPVGHGLKLKVSEDEIVGSTE